MIDARGDHHDEPDMDNARRCEWDGCPRLSTMTDDFCAPHQQRHDDEKDPYEPDRWTLDAQEER